MITYIYIYIYISLSPSLSLYIYIYIESPPWINKRPPPYFCCSSKRPFSLFIYYQQGQTYTQLWPRLY